MLPQILVNDESLLLFADILLTKPLENYSSNLVLHLKNERSKTLSCKSKAPRSQTKFFFLTLKS